jgi:hypothetical protein
MKKEVLVLLLIWLWATSLNINKAVHIDDTGHLEIAKEIIKNPLHPMSGMVNWENSAEPVHLLNQPHLFFYLLAACIYFWGDSEIAFHLLVSLFSFLGILFFYFLAKNLRLRHPTVWTAFLALGPGFIPSQNIMGDIPMLSLWLVFFWAILHPMSSTGGYRYYIFASLASTLAILIKYLSLVLLPILLLDIVLKKRWNAIGTLAIPVFSLAGWSLFNYFDYGGIHILERKNFPFGFWNGVYNSINWAIALGAVAPFSVLVLPDFFRRRIGKTILIASFIFFLVITLIRTPYFASGLKVGILGGCFFSNGLALTLLCFFRGSRGLRNLGPASGDEERRLLILSLWILAPMVFIIFFSPFPAVRHVMVVIPAILLMLGMFIRERVPNRALYVAVLFTFVTGGVMGVSDWEYADVYRVQASRIRAQLRPASSIWFLGHWGWQWYAKKAGMKEYDTQRTHLTEGDLVIIPDLVRKQELLKEHGNLLIKKFEITVEPTPLTFIRTMSLWPWGGYYAFSIEGNSLPWTVTSQPLEKFSIFEVGRGGRRNGPQPAGPGHDL